MVKVSVVVPVYNKEKVLKKNIQTILNQTLSDIEIILINDGSTDNSGQICDELKYTDNRVRVIHQNNKGVSAARNKGISISTGRYIGFVDPDDWIEENMYENMYKKIKKTQAEVCLCNYSVDWKEKTQNVLLSTSSNILNKEQIFKILILNMIAPETVNSSEQGVMGSVCRLLIDRKTIGNSGISFKEGLPLMEDLLFSIKLLSTVDNVYIDEGVYYHYVQDNNSVTNNHRDGLYELHSTINNELVNYLKGNEFYKKSIHRINNRYVNSAQTVIRNEVQNKETIFRKLNNISRVCKNENLQKSLNTIVIKKFTLRKKIVLFSMKYNFNILLYIYYYFIVNLYRL